MSTKLHVANLQPWITSGDLARKFRFYGIVTSAAVVADEHVGRSHGHGFVEMADPAAAQNAITSLNGSFYDGELVSVRTVESTSETI